MTPCGCGINISHKICQTFLMRKLTTTLCLTVYLLLGGCAAPVVYHKEKFHSDLNYRKVVLECNSYANLGSDQDIGSHIVSSSTVSAATSAGMSAVSGTANAAIGAGASAAVGGLGGLLSAPINSALEKQRRQTHFMSRCLYKKGYSLETNFLWHLCPHAQCMFEGKAALIGSDKTEKEACYTSKIDELVSLEKKYNRRFNNLGICNSFLISTPKKFVLYWESQRRL